MENRGCGHDGSVEEWFESRDGVVCAGKAHTSKFGATLLHEREHDAPKPGHHLAQAIVFLLVGIHGPNSVVE